MILLPLLEYDYIIVAFSGGKDSLACLLHLLDLGVPLSKIELWHHEIDGREGSHLMDWPCTPDYCRKVAAALGVRIYFSWRQGGFEREMLRKNARIAPVLFETPTGPKIGGGTRGRLNTRRMFPQVSADLSVRWCSPALKIDVCSLAINQQERFLWKKTLLVTGERAEESTARAHYKTQELHRYCHNIKRTVHQWRSIHQWKREQVWDLIRSWRINPHPAYRLGWGRVSCMKCIFGSPNQWASALQLDPSGVLKIVGYEQEFGKTIKRGTTVTQLCDKGVPYDMKPEDIQVALSVEFKEQIILPQWTMPAGAFGESCGPT